LTAEQTIQMVKIKISLRVEERLGSLLRCGLNWVEEYDGPSEAARDAEYIGRLIDEGKLPR
jgi:hypothetical protein